MERENDAIWVLSTIGSAEQAATLARTLVESRLAACVNVVGPIRSIYRWQGAVEDDAEHLLCLKTTRKRYRALEERILAAHPYDVPEVIALPVVEGAADYLDWVRRSVSD